MKRVFAVGCIIISAIVAVGTISLVAYGPKLGKKVIGFVSKAMADVTHVATIESDWMPPAEPDGANAWIPPRIGSWRAVVPQHAVEGVPRLKIEHPGFGGVYESEGVQVEVNV